jgi:hypothetical protein
MTQHKRLGFAIIPPASQTNEYARFLLVDYNKNLAHIQSNIITSCIYCLYTCIVEELLYPSIIK